MPNKAPEFSTAVSSIADQEQDELAFLQSESDAKNMMDKECKQRECQSHARCSFSFPPVGDAGSAAIADIRKQNELLKSFMQEGDDGKKRFTGKIPMDMFLGPNK